MGRVGNVKKNTVLGIILLAALSISILPLSIQRVGVSISPPTVKTENLNYQQPLIPYKDDWSISSDIIAPDNGTIEPGDNQTVYVEVGGGGFFLESGVKNNFGFHVTYNGCVDGHVNYIDRADGYHFKSLLIENFGVEVDGDGYAIHVYGWGEIDGQIYRFHLKATDNGEPAKSDSIYLWIYFSEALQLFDHSGGVLGGGNINIKLA